MDYVVTQVLAGIISYSDDVLAVGKHWKRLIQDSTDAQDIKLFLQELHT